MIKIDAAIQLMISFGTFILLLLSFVVTIVVHFTTRKK